MTDIALLTDEYIAERLDQNDHVALARLALANTKRTPLHDQLNVVSREASNPDPDLWPAPQPLKIEAEELRYPVESLPQCVRAAVEEVCSFIQAPLPLVASSALGTLSLAIQAHVDVERAKGLTGPTGIYLLIIADSGERKSTADRKFTKSIRDYETEKAEEFKPVVQNYHADLDAWEAKRAGIRERIKSDAKAKKATFTSESELRELENSKPEPPQVPRLIYSDATPEAIAFNLATRWPSAGVLSAEAGSVLGSHGMSSESAMRYMAMLNQLWDGGGFPMDRRSVQSFFVGDVRFTMVLQVQEPTIRNFLEKSGSLARGTGFLARFLLARPMSTQGHRPFSEPPEHWPHMSAFNQRISEILRQEIPIDENGNLTPLMLTLSPGAKAAWVNFHDAVEGQLRAGGELHEVRDVASKSADNAARLAALFHVFSGATGPISVDAFESASSIVAWHLSESKRFFSEIVGSDDLTEVAKLDAWLISHCNTVCVQVINKSWALQYGPLRKADSLAFSLRALEEMDRVRLVRDGKRVTIHINPALLTIGAEG